MNGNDPGNDTVIRWAAVIVLGVFVVTVAVLWWLR